MKKRIVATLLTAAMAISLFAGCGSTASTSDASAEKEEAAEEEAEEEEETEAEEAEEEAETEAEAEEAAAVDPSTLEAATWNIGSSSSGAFYYVATAMGQVLTPVLSDYKVEVIGEATNGSVENVRRLQAGELQMALAGPVNILTEIEAGNVNADDVCFIAPIYANTYHLMAQPSLGITTVDELFDLIGKQDVSFGIGEPGAGLQALWAEVWEAGGYTRDDVTVEEISTAEFVDKFIDGDIDVIKVDAAYPASNVTNVLTSAADGAQILSWSEEAQAAINAVDPYIVPDVIPGGTYDGYDEDINTICFYAPLFARADLNEEQVYQFTKAMFENAEEMAKIYQTCDQISLDNVAAAVESYAADGIATHPGALRYYKEMGIIE